MLPGNVFDAFVVNVLLERTPLAIVGLPDRVS